MTSDATPVLELRDVRKRYGEVEALRGVNLTIEARRGRRPAGPQRRGQDDHGQPHARPCADRRPARRGSSGSTPPTAGRAAVVASSCRNVASPGADGAGDRRSRPLVLSGAAARGGGPRPRRAPGARARRGLARSRAASASGSSSPSPSRGDPDALFLDEPTVGMDVEARQIFLASLRRFAASGKTMVLTTHYLEEADQLAQPHPRHRPRRGDRRCHARGSQGARRRQAGALPHVAGPLADEVFRGLAVQRLEIADHRVSLLSNEPEVILRELFARGVTIARPGSRGGLARGGVAQPDPATERAP